MEREFEATFDAVSANRWALEFVRRSEYTEALKATLIAQLDRANEMLWDPATTNDAVVSAHEDVLALLPTGGKDTTDITTQILSVRKCFDGTWYKGSTPIVRSPATLDHVRDTLRGRGSWWLRRDRLVEDSYTPVPTPAAPVLSGTPAPVQTHTSAPQAPKAAPKREAVNLPPVGTKLVGHYGGKTAEAVVTAEGVSFNGKTYGSLSASALDAVHSLGSTVKAINGRSFWEEAQQS
jgi:hypothetical protein